MSCRSQQPGERRNTCQAHWNLPWVRAAIVPDKPGSRYKEERQTRFGMGRIKEKSRPRETKNGFLSAFLSVICGGAWALARKRGVLRRVPHDARTRRVLNVRYPPSLCRSNQSRIATFSPGRGLVSAIGSRDGKGSTVSPARMRVPGYCGQSIHSGASGTLPGNGRHMGKAGRRAHDVFRGASARTDCGGHTVKPGRPEALTRQNARPMLTSWRSGEGSLGEMDRRDIAFIASYSIAERARDSHFCNRCLYLRIDFREVPVRGARVSGGGVKRT